MCRIASLLTTEDILAEYVSWLMLPETQQGFQKRQEEIGAFLILLMIQSDKCCYCAAEKELVIGTISLEAFILHKKLNRLTVNPKGSKQLLKPKRRKRCARLQM